MTGIYRVVDLFAGPGGLAEGFSAFALSSGQQPFQICLSVEKDAAAHRTLLMRSFYRQFENAAPTDYYDFLAGDLTHAQLVDRFPDEWSEAQREALQLELGKPEHDQLLDSRLNELLGDDTETILIGGPPCQAYSLVGRSRNRGVAGYRASDDHRHYLYREYIRIIHRLRPAAFVMENVKGLLSSRVDNDLIFERVLKDLEAAGGPPDSYVLVPLASPGSAHEFLVRAEDHGIPQCRHRVIVVGVRADLARNMATRGGALISRMSRATVRDAIGGLPPLRSGLSRGRDSASSWKAAAVEAFGEASRSAQSNAGPWGSRIAALLTDCSDLLARTSDLQRNSRKPGSPSPNRDLDEWYSDPLLRSLPNHETRGHMPADLSRYCFAAVFAEEFGRSPKAHEYPESLAPRHRNWATGKFADRFRVQRWDAPSTTVTSHISKDGHYFIHPDPLQCRSLTVREAARLQTFPDNYVFLGNRTEQFVQVGNAVPPLLARHIAAAVFRLLNHRAEMAIPTERHVHVNERLTTRSLA